VGFVSGGKQLNNDNATQDNPSLVVNAAGTEYGVKSRTVKTGKFKYTSIS